MTDLERIQAAALSQQITLEQYACQVLKDPGGYSRRTVAAAAGVQLDQISTSQPDRPYSRASRSSAFGDQ